ncbi:hypothetical protein EDC01DRAFT_710529 [Geopyxis carbonaria]|nr:hypothetical protein EDC01DRAFT_710529 [Geopyxis carbonaria]
MRLLVGDDVGQAKVIETSRGIDTTQPTSARATTTSFFPPSRTRPIQHATAVNFLERKNLAAVFSKGGLLRIFDPLSAPHSPDIVFSHTLSVSPETDSIALGVVADTTLYAATASGQVLFLNLQNGTHTTATLPGPIGTFAVTTTKIQNGLPTALAVASEGRETEVFTASGSDGAWTSAWKAKNVKNNAIKLEAPIHPTQLIFLPSLPGTFRLIVGTKQGLLRIYDSAVARRPVWSQQLSKHAIMALRLHPSTELTPPEAPLCAVPGETPEKAQLARECALVFADHAEAFEVYSLTQRRSLGLYKGLSGAVLDVAVDAEAGVVAGVGFGRYVAAYNAAGGRALLTRVFTKTAGCCVAILDTTDKVVEPEKKTGEDEEDVWEGMEEVGADEEGTATDEDEDDGGVTGKLVKVRTKRKGGQGKEGGGKRPRAV